MRACVPTVRPLRTGTSLAQRHDTFACSALEKLADHALGCQSGPCEHFGRLPRLDLVERDGEREGLLHGLGNK